jgi:hypothetical protein
MSEPRWKVNSHNVTRLLVHIPLDARERLAEASRLTGKSQQSIIRCGLVAILDSLLNHPAAAQAQTKPSRNGRRTRKVVAQ